MLLNVERARRTMDEHGLQALVATAPENVTYVSGYANWPIYTFADMVTFALAPREGPLALVVPIDAAEYLAQYPPFEAEIYTYGTFHVRVADRAALSPEESRVLEIRENAGHASDALGALALAVDARGLRGAPLGVDERGVSAALWRRCDEELAGGRARPAAELLRSVRMVKTEPEVDRLRVAVRAVESGIQAAFACARPGTTETELEQTIRAVTMRAGVAPGHCETSTGGRAGGCFPCSPHARVSRGDVIRSDCGGRYLGYWADTGRTAACGELDDGLERCYAALRAGMEAMLAAVRPGLAISELSRIGIETVVDHGIADYRRHHVGHAIGLEMYEAPLLTGPGGATDIHSLGSHDTVLESGMVLNLELPYYELGRGGLQIEDTLVVRPGGHERLTTSSHDIVRCPAPA